MSIQAQFIGGPWDGMTIKLREVLPYYEVAEMDPVVWPAGQDAVVEPVPLRKVRYALYDSWPVKYLVDPS